MINYKKIIVISIGLIILGFASYFAYNRLIRPLIIKKEQRMGQEVWQTALKKEDQSFRYSIRNVAKIAGKEAYTQTYSGDWSKDGEIKGTYEFKNTEETIKNVFISLKNITYSKEEASQKWLIWQTKDYPELVYYVPSNVLKSVDKDRINLVQNKNNLYTFDCILPFQSNALAPSAGSLLVTLNKAGYVVGIEYERAAGDMNIKTQVDFTNYGEVVVIKAPKGEEIMK